MTLTSFQAVPKPVLQSDSGSDSGSGSDSSSGSSSGSGSDSSSDSDSELRLSRPVFLKKKQKVSSTPSHDSSRAALAKAEHLQQIESKSSDKVPFDGIDDSDDIDPEEEYKQWQLREASRKKRDAKLLAEAELTKEDAIRRKKGSLKENISEEAEQSLPKEDVEKDQHKGSKLGSFYSEHLDDKFLKRNYKDVEGKEDHSRPTKYKRS